MTKPNNLQSNYQLALTYHKRLPDRIRRYLHSKGIPEPIVCRYRLGWNEERITIPITNKERQVVFFMLAKDPEDKSDSPAMVRSHQDAIELYGWERLVFKRQRIVICEGMFDRLILEAHGISAIVSTAGVSVLLPAWAEHLRETPEIYICFHNSAASFDAAGAVAALIPRSKIVELPPEVGMDGTIEDFFVKLGKTREAFESLLNNMPSNEA